MAQQGVVRHINDLLDKFGDSGGMPKSSDIRDVISSLARSNFTTVTGGPYPQVATDKVIRCNAATAGFNVNLLGAASFPGQTIIVKKIDNTTNAVTIQAAGSDKIDGAATLVLNTAYAKATLMSNGTGWDVIG